MDYTSALLFVNGYAEEKTAVFCFKVPRDICLERHDNYKNINQHRQWLGLELNAGRFSTK
jgi:hypothetical protein